MSNDIEWKMVNLAKNCTIKARIGWQGLRSDEYRKNGDFLLITGTDFENGFINYDTCSYVDEWRYLQDANIQLKNDDVLITKDGTIGKIAFVKNLEMPATLNSGIFVIRPKEDIGIYPEYLSLVFKSSIFTDFLDRITAGSTIVHLYQKDIVKFEFPIPYKNGTPDLETQKQIAQKLGDMDRLIAAKEKLLAKKRNLKVAAMQKLIKDEEGANWKKVKIGDFLRVKTGSKNTEDKIDDGKYPLYVRSPIVERINEYTHDCEAVLTAGDGVGTGKVFHYVNGKFAAHQRVYVISNFTEIDGKYFYYQFSQNFYDEVMKYTAKSSVDSVRRGMITGMEIALPFNSDGSPDLIEQRRIASILSDMDSEISAIEKEITKLQNLKTAMMQKMFCFGDSDSNSE